MSLTRYATAPLWAAAALLSFQILSPAARAEDPGSMLAQTGSSAGPTALNPAVSLDGLFALSQFNRSEPVVFDGGHDPKFSGFNMQQVELSFNANVDPYLRGDANIVLTKDGIEVEEAYATTLDFPWNLQLKGGQFFNAFGRHNATHPHAWDFANKPLVLGRFFGGDGLRNPGLQISWLTPLPWYAELIGSVQNSTGATVQSFRPDPAAGVNPAPMRTLADGVALVKLNNFFSVTDAVSLNLGASALNGPNNQSDNTRTRIYGGDLFLKIRQPDSLSFLTLTVEALERFYDLAGAPTNQDWGWYAAADYRLGEGWERWHLGLRYDSVGNRGLAPNTTLATLSGTDYDTGSRWRVSPVITFYPSEFSKVRLQYDYDQPQTLSSAQQVATLQLEFLMGAHGAHKF